MCGQTGLLTDRNKPDTDGDIHSKIDPLQRTDTTPETPTEKDTKTGQMKNR